MGRQFTGSIELLLSFHQLAYPCFTLKFANIAMEATFKKVIQEHFYLDCYSLFSLESKY